MHGKSGVGCVTSVTTISMYFYTSSQRAKMNIQVCSSPHCHKISSCAFKCNGRPSSKRHLFPSPYLFTSQSFAQPSSSTPPNYSASAERPSRNSDPFPSPRLVQHRSQSHTPPLHSQDTSPPPNHAYQKAPDTPKAHSTSPSGSTSCYPPKNYAASVPHTSDSRPWTKQTAAPTP